jgi:hypothetical protein
MECDGGIAYHWRKLVDNHEADLMVALIKILFLTVREGFTCLLQAPHRQKVHVCLYLFIIQMLLDLLWDAD